MGKEVYVVVSDREELQQERTGNVLYTGSDFDKARGFGKVGVKIFVWVNGVHIKTYCMTRTNGIEHWGVAYDKVLMLRGEIIIKQEELSKLEKLITEE
ncbi:hypothetical protein [Bacillus phage vB_BtM_BMBsp2]|nr:hypothetical protein [Bacillus phage vB_BtM_BMBsp2]